MMSADALMALAILLPVIGGIIALLLRTPAGQKAVVIPVSAILVLVSLLLVQHGSFTYSPPSLGGISWETILIIGDAALILTFFYYGWKLKNNLILGLTAVQTLVVIYLEMQLAQGHAADGPVFYVDSLALVMALVIGVVGPAIAFYGLHYMDNHEHHLHLEKTRQPRFFAVILVFLGAMNGLVFANSLTWLFFFWEVTTLASFLLIGHDGTEIALKNAQRALWMNLTGGIGFALGMVVMWQTSHTLSLQTLIKTATPATLLTLGLAFLVFAGFTKAAQMPFQSWLLGAMVAPTPVSALLHSSTMVKAGVYLIVRLAPGFEGTWLSQAVAIAGGFTFLATAILALSQSNAKRVLAYSTISNLGLIIACAGINTALAISAATLLILFHAVSKGLLFMAVGAIEQKIGSRDIEDMEGLIGRMPVTTVITMLGILTMILPPFGMLIGKWAAIAAATRSPLAAVMIILGSAFTVVFWGKWMGRMLSRDAGHDEVVKEEMHSYFSVPLVGLAGLAIAMTAAIGWLMDILIEPAVQGGYAKAGLEGAANAGGLVSSVGAFPVWPLLIVLAIIMVIGYMASRDTSERIVPAYLCGENDESTVVAEFHSIADQPAAVKMRSYYFEDWLGEKRITDLANPVAIALLVVVLGVALI